MGGTSMVSVVPLEWGDTVGDRGDYTFNRFVWILAGLREKRSECSRFTEKNRNNTWETLLLEEYTLLSTTEGRLGMGATVAPSMGPEGVLLDIFLYIQSTWTKNTVFWTWCFIGKEPIKTLTPLLLLVEIVLYWLCLDRELDVIHTHKFTLL